MNFIVCASAWIVLGLVTIGVLLYPFRIGKERQPYSASGYLMYVVTGATTVMLAGRCLNWW